MRLLLPRCGFRLLRGAALSALLALPATAQVATPTPGYTPDQANAYAASQAQKNTCGWLFKHFTATPREVMQGLPNVQEAELSPYAGDEGFATAVQQAFPLNRLLSADFDIDNDGKTDTVFLIGYVQRRPGSGEASQVVELKATLGTPTPQGGGSDLFKALVPPAGMASPKIVTSVVPLNLFHVKSSNIFYYDRWNLKAYRADSPGMSAIAKTSAVTNIRLLNVGGMNLLWLIAGNGQQQFLFRYMTDTTTVDLGHRLVMFCQYP